MRTKIYIEPIGGLANRMRAIASALSLRESLDGEITCVWKKRAELNCDFSDLFEPIRFLNLRPKYIRYKLVTSTVDKGGVNKLFALYINRLRGINICIDEHDVRKYKNLTIELIEKSKSVYIRTGQIFSPSADQCYHLFKPTKTLANEIEIVAKEFSKNTIGIHIRRTDNAWSIENSPTEHFIDSMKYELLKNPESNFFLCTDDLKEKEVLTNEFEGKIITRKIQTSRDTTEGIKDALIDLYALAKTKKIVGSFGSSFSILAGKLGQIEVEILRK